jgi:DNA-directed RNA polymerase subunit RPC12/RpoP
MPVTMSCECGKQLRVNEEHVGKRIRCPGCGEPVLVKNPEEKSAAKKPAGGGSTAGMLTFNCACGKKMQAKAEFAGKTVKCPECGEGVKVPRGGKDEDDRDDRNGSRPARDERDDRDERDERVGSRQTRSRRDDADEDERPRSRKSKPEKKGGSGMFWLLIGGVAVLLLVGVVVLLMMFMGGGASGEMALVPGDAVGFTTVRVADILNSEVGKEALAALPEPGKAALKQVETSLGSELADVERVTFVARSVPMDGLMGGGGGVGMGKDMGGPMGKGPPLGKGGLPKGPGGRPGGNMGNPADEFYGIVTLSKPADEKKITSTGDLKGAVPAEYNGKKYYTAGDIGVYFHNDKTVVVGSPNALKKAIDQAVKPRTDGALAGVLSRVSKQHIAAGFAPPSELTAMAKLLGGGNKGVTALADLQDVLLAGNLKGKSFEFDVTAAFKAGASAADAKAELDSLLQQAPAFLLFAPPDVQKPAKDFLANTKVSQSGTSLTLTSKSDIDVGLFKGALEKVVGGGGGGGAVGAAANAMKSKNNLQQMALAFHNVHDAEGSMKYAIVNPQTKAPLLSWRVAILPYIEEGQLFNQIHRNEAWNSPFNRQFWNRMPKVFELPGKQAPAGMTYYQTFVGDGAVFDRGNNLTRQILSIKDGTSNTLLLAEAANAVNWMQPTDIDFQNGGPNGFPVVGRVGGHFPNGFHVALADGTVRLLPMTLKPQTFQAAITVAGGENDPLP